MIKIIKKYQQINIKLITNCAISKNLINYEYWEIGAGSEEIAFKTSSKFSKCNKHPIFVHNNLLSEGLLLSTKI